jgi:AcrR family transcriptional regulator
MCNSACGICTQLRAVTLELVGEDGIEALTSERIAARAACSVDEVTAHYPDALSCLYDTYEEVSDSIYEDFAEAFETEWRWRQALRLGAHTLLLRLTARPAEARLCFVEILRADHELLRRRDLARRRLVDLFVSELGRRRENAEESRIPLELLIGAGFQAIARDVASGKLNGLPELAPELESRAFVFEPVAA